jgi:ubiquinone/menaquinone biosynthesis C-methylase UbiE
VARKTPNAQYNLAAPDSLAVKTAVRVRRDMFAMFMDEFRPTATDTVLDVGVTSDQSYASSNYFEVLYPYKGQITAVGQQDATFLEELYPGLKYVKADALDLAFPDASFDLVHASALLEHVGSIDNQGRVIREACRVARRGVCLTTPNRWFPIEFHTLLPLVHWLPKPTCRAIFRRMGYGPLAEEESLNLMTARELAGIAKSTSEWRFSVKGARLLGWKSNLILFGHR